MFGLISGKFFEIASYKSRKQHCGPACRVKAKYWRDKPRSAAQSKAKPVLLFVGACPTCQKPMYSSRPHQKKYCSPACRQAAYRARRAWIMLRPGADGTAS